jgi:hypothetical protein
MHIGTGAMPSKTEAMYFPPPWLLYSGADTSRLGVLDYLGGILLATSILRQDKSSSLTSDADVDKRIRPASGAFGALENILTNKDIDLKVKGSVYVALCLSILLYGSEIWCLREDLFNRLRHFHHRCARTMCRITIDHTIRHRISSASLFKYLLIQPFETYIIVVFFDGQAMSPECH